MSATDPSAWFRKADNDLLSIANNLAAEETPWDGVTFHAQQAAEKYLKGFLVFNGIVPPKIHDLARLDLCLAYDAGLDTLRSDCIELTDAGFRSHYPEMPDEIYGDVDDAEDFLARSVGAVRDILDRVGRPAPRPM